ncbi:MAG TPA: LytTR family DNA-binding domain-containing protein [Chitinophagaceae bacterium]|nr:LytTR family DNA-binding domain-containing protein [Chitinophagaceae bacterium]
MKILIVEDEKIAASQLARLIKSYDKNIEILPVIRTCLELKKWVEEESEADLIFCDIELADGNVLRVLQKLKLNTVIIFVTAYDHFWSQALKLNGIDYILKPISKEKIQEALSKFVSLKNLFSSKTSLFSRLEKLMQYENKLYKKRFPVKINNEVFILESDSIVFFRIVNGVIFAYTNRNKKFPMEEETLNELEEKLNPEIFFRINRSEIINAGYIDSIKILEGSEYNIQTKEIDEKLSVSNSRIPLFKEWLSNPLIYPKKDVQ